MSIFTLSPRNGATPVAFRLDVDVETATKYKESFSECDVEINEEEELPVGDWREALLRK